MANGGWQKAEGSYRLLKPPGGRSIVSIHFGMDVSMKKPSGLALALALSTGLFAAGAASSIVTRAPSSRAASAAHRAALPLPTTRISQALRSFGDMTCQSTLTGTRGLFYYGTIRWPPSSRVNKGDWPHS